MAPYADPVPEGFGYPQVEFQSVPGVFATVRLPAEGRKWSTPEERDAEREQASRRREAFERGEEPEPVVPAEGPGLRIRVAATRGVLPLGRVRVVLVREGDGLAHETSPRFKDGVAARAVAAEPGTWTATAGDPAGLLRPASKTVELREGWAEVSFTLEPNPLWKPRVVERAADGSEEELAAPLAGRFLITTEDGVVEAFPFTSSEDASNGSICVPASGPFAVEYRAEDGRRARVLLDGPPAGPGPTLPLPPPVPEVPWVDESTRPRDFPMARLAVLLPDGRPAGGAEVLAVSAGSPHGPDARVRRSDQRFITLDEEGAGECGFDRGERLLVVARGDGAEGILPFETRIDGPGPWTLRWPVGEVAVRAVDEAGGSLSEFAVVTGAPGTYAVDAVDGVVHLRGASKGPLRLWVSAPGRRIHDLRLVLAEGERRDVVVRMHRAQPR
jgi:hypothetical protein